MSARSTSLWEFRPMSERHSERFEACRALATAALIASTAMGVSSAGMEEQGQRSPTMSKAVQAMVHDEALRAYPAKFVGLDDTRDGQIRLTIHSGRTLLAAKLSKAAVEGGRYTARVSDLKDTLVIFCGATDFGNGFDCSKVTLRNADGLLVRPTLHSSTPTEITNAFGAKWVVRTVAAEFPANELGRGFVVTYQSTSGVEFDHNVSSDDAVRWLLLDLPSQR